MLPVALDDISANTKSASSADSIPGDDVGITCSDIQLAGLNDSGAVGEIIDEFEDISINNQSISQNIDTSSLNTDNNYVQDGSVDGLSSKSSRRKSIESKWLAVTYTVIIARCFCSFISASN